MDAVYLSFVYLTPVFLIYWMVSLSLIIVGGAISLGAGFLEVMRLWLKPLFWMNFIYFLAAEVLFSLVYWAGYAVSKTSALPGFLGGLGRFMDQLYSLLFRAMESAAGFSDGVFAWAVISLMLFGVLMTPYMMVHFRVTTYFKRRVFSQVLARVGIEEGRFVTASPERMLPSALVCQVVSHDARAHQWITEVFRDHRSGAEGDPRKFRLSTVNADHMQWRLQEQSFDFWEAQLSYTKKRPKRDDEGHLSYEDSDQTVFDGLIIRANGVLTSAWRPTVFEIEKAEYGDEVPHREAHDQGLLMGVIEVFGFGGAEHPDQDNSEPGDFPKALDLLEIAEPRSLRFVGADERDVYLFIETGLSGTMFDLNMNIGINRNAAMFGDDLRFVHDYCGLMALVVDALATKAEHKIPRLTAA